MVRVRAEQIPEVSRFCAPDTFLGVAILQGPARTQAFSTLIHRFPQALCHNLLDAELQNIYLPRQIEPGRLETLPFSSEVGAV